MSKRLKPMGAQTRRQEEGIHGQCLPKFFVFPKLCCAQKNFY